MPHCLSSLAIQKNKNVSYGDIWLNSKSTKHLKKFPCPNQPNSSFPSKKAKAQPKATRDSKPCKAVVAMKIPLVTLSSRYEQHTRWSNKTRLWWATPLTHLQVIKSQPVYNIKYISTHFSTRCLNATLSSLAGAAGISQAL